MSTPCSWCGCVDGHDSPHCLGAATIAGPFDSLEKIEAEKARAREASIQQRFEEFHARNPQVYRELVSMARQARSKGHERIGIATLFEALRWNHMMAVNHTDDEFRLNNTFRSRYSRLIEANEPDLRGMFETRSLATE